MPEKQQFTRDPLTLPRCWLTIMGYPTVDPRTQGCIDRDTPRLAAAQDPDGKPWLVPRARSFDCSDLIEARNRPASRAVESQLPWDVYLTVDRDMTWPPGTLELLARHAHKEQAAIGVVAAKRVKGGGFAASMPEDFTLCRDELVELGPDYYVGSGILAVSRTVFDAMRIKPGSAILTQQGFWTFWWPSLSLHSLSRPRYLPEDYGFCEQVRAAGCRVFVATWPWIGHVGAYEYTAIDATDELAVDRRVAAMAKAEHADLAIAEQQRLDAEPDVDPQ
jgi:hypothetical protein